MVYFYKYNTVYFVSDRKRIKAAGKEKSEC